MKSYSPALLAHLASGATTLATCWKVTRRDGKQYGYTSLDRDITFQGFLYSATVGVAASAIAASSDFSVQNLNVSGLLQAGLSALGAFTEEDILAGRWDNARVTIVELNYNDLTMGAGTLQTGTIGELRTGRLTFSTESIGLMQSLQQNIGHTASPGCWKDVGSVECGIDLSAFTFTGTVGTAANDRSWKDTSLAKADHYFQYGKVTWLTSANGNAGLSMEVKDYAATGEITLQGDMPFTVAAGDTYTISAGCNKLLKTAELIYDTAIASTVTSASSESQFTDSTMTQIDHYFDGGRVTWTGGSNVPLVLEVQSFVGGVFTLLGSLPNTIDPGDAYTVEARITTGDVVYQGDCKVKFSNAINHGGFAEQPGNDRVLGGAN